MLQSGIYNLDNILGSKLPETGGPGALPFAIGGAAVMLGAAGVSVYRRKKIATITALIEKMNNNE
jgi:LPXTG-motif cell wall-anchored protein